MSDMELIPGMNQGVRLGRTIGQAVSWLFMVCIRPVAILTGAVFRTKMGERYYTGVHFAIAWLLLWAVVGKTLTTPVISIQTKMAAAVSGTRVSSDAEVPLFAIVVVFAWPAALLLSFIEHRIKVWCRYQDGTRWHSRSRGIGRFAGLSPLAELLATVAVTLVLFYFGCVFFGWLAAFSGVLNWLEYSNAKRELHNRILNAVDAQIEGETFTKAIDHHLSPKDSLGVLPWIPKSFRGRSMQHYARAVGLPVQPSRSAATTTDNAASLSNVPSAIEAKPLTGSVAAASGVDTSSSA